MRAYLRSAFLPALMFCLLAAECLAGGSGPKSSNSFLDDPKFKKSLPPANWQVLRFCIDNRGKQVGDGECAALAVRRSAWPAPKDSRPTVWTPTTSGANWSARQLRARATWARSSWATSSRSGTPKLLMLSRRSEGLGHAAPHGRRGGPEQRRQDRQGSAPECRGPWHFTCAEEDRAGRLSRWPVSRRDG